MIRFRDEERPFDAEIDLMDPWFQNSASCRAILDMLRTLTEKFQDFPEETTDLAWTAFRALAKAGAVEGIIRSMCTYAEADAPCTEYFWVRGDYLTAMPSRPVLTTEPIECVLVQARLTTTGIRWAEYLAEEKTKPVEQVQGFVLQLIWNAEAVRGHVTKVNPPISKPIEKESIEVPHVACELVVDKDETTVKSEGMDNEPFGGPQEDLYDNRVVNWFGKRLYLGPKGSQVRELFMLLAKKPGVPHNLSEVQRAVDGMETYREEHGEDAFQKAMNRIAKALSKLRKHLRENRLDDHVVILKEGSRDYPNYTLMLRFGNS